MDPEHALVLQRRNMLFGDKPKCRSILSVGDPRAFSALIYFSPVPKEELEPFLRGEKDLRPQSPEYNRFQLIKRAHIGEVYNCLGTLMFAIVNVDAINDMRSSRSIIAEHAGDRHPVLADLDGIIDDANTYIERLAGYPSDEEACQAISDLVQSYKETIGSKVIPIQAELGLCVDDLLRIMPRYGVTRDCAEFDTYGKIRSYLEDAGYGFSHMAWTRERGDERTTGFAADTIKLHLTTTSNVLFRMSFRPDSDQEICDIYGIPEGVKGNQYFVPPLPLQPIYVYISTRGEKTVHADRLDMAMAGLKAAFSPAELGENRSMVYCPHPRCLKELIGAN